MSEKKQRPKIYIAGPITLGDRRKNYLQFAVAHRFLARCGAAVLNPGLSMALSGAWEIDHETWLESCLPWVAEADAVLRLPGESKGADAEVAHAESLGIPVFTGMANLRMHFDDVKFNLLYPKTDAERETSYVFYDELGTIHNGSHPDLQKLFKTLASYVSGDQPCGQECSASACPSAPESEEVTSPVVVDSPLTDEQIKAERQKVYGDPLENHKGIAQMWSPLLQPHAKDIANGKPVPPHVVAQLMVALKLDRMRLTYHEDNYADLRNYLSFAQQWQQAGEVTP